MLVDLLEGEALSVLLVLDQVHRAVGTVGDELRHLEILLAGRFRLEGLATGDGVGAARVLAVGSLGCGGVLLLLVLLVLLVLCY